jgi:catechol 2,3-dioxygenase-like lactoylglutathione lyase family enzyme
VLVRHKVGGMLAGCPLFAFVPTRNMERAAEFYGGTLGLEVLEHTPYALVLDAAGTTVRVTSVEELQPQPFTVLGWLVEDIDATAAALVAAGVEPLRYEGMEQDDAGVWTAPGGARVLWFTDPDGNTLSLTAAP